MKQNVVVPFPKHFAFPFYSHLENKTKKKKKNQKNTYLRIAKVHQIHSASLAQLVTVEVNLNTS